MNKLSLRKLSLLGLVLTAASAVTAAVLPKEEAKKTFNGVQQASTGAAGQITCVNGSGVVNCTVTADSGTTGGKGTSVDNDGSSVAVNSSKSPS